MLGVSCEDGFIDKGCTWAVIGSTGLGYRIWAWQVIHGFSFIVLIFMNPEIMSRFEAIVATVGWM